MVYGMLAYFAVLALRTWKWRVAAVFAAALLVVLIGLSRMYLGVHYLSDVAAGYAAGGLWLSALINGCGDGPPRRPPRQARVRAALRRSSENSCSTSLGE